MSTEHSPDDIRTSTIVSRSPGLAYERMREVRQTHFSQPLARKLRVEGAILVALAAALSLTLGVGGGPGGASAGLVTFGAAAGGLVAAGVTTHAGVGVYRLLREPLTEHVALALISVEDAASYLGIATGGMVVAGTVVAVAVELASGGGAAPGSGGLTTVVIVGAAAVAGLAMATGRYFDGRFPRSP